MHLVFLCNCSGTSSEVIKYACDSSCLMAGECMHQNLVNHSFANRHSFEFLPLASRSSAARNAYVLAVLKKNFTF